MRLQTSTTITNHAVAIATLTTIQLGNTTQARHMHQQMYLSVRDMYNAHTIFEAPVNLSEHSCFVDLRDETRRQTARIDRTGAIERK